MRFSTSISALQISVWNWYCFKNFKLQISICSHHLSRKSEIFHFTWSHTTSRHYKFACIHTYILLHVHQYTIIYRSMYVYVIYKWLMPCCLACKTSLSLVYTHITFSFILWWISCHFSHISHFLLTHLPHFVGALHCQRQMRRACEWNASQLGSLLLLAYICI